MTAKADKLQSTVIISGRFTERRAQLSATHPDEDPVAEVLEPGSMVGRYLTLSRVGVGGMGVVYRAHDTELNRTVALKVLPPQLCKHTEYLKRFRTEAQAQARLNSPHIITLYELMEHSAGEILVLEYVEGETLENRLRHYGPMSVSEAIRIFDQALRGVEHIHQMGVVHRDLKPSNIFITRDGAIKLMDFGVARLMDNHDPSQNGTMVGTLLYISPEQINGRETDYRSDIYTLGVSLFEAVTGRLPFERRSDYALMHAHVQENPPSPKEFQRRLPRELESVILKAIEKDPNRRFQTTAEFRATLLGLGLVERRQTTLSRTGNEKRRPWKRQQESAGHRIWGGAWFDVSLATMAMLLVLALDTYPLHKLSEDNNFAANAPTQKVAQRNSTITAPRRPVSMAPKTTESNQFAAKKPRDKYETLRQAWGS
ncbi:MAG TPA: serine/threonine-protein kinase [Sulfuricaulis sp.]|nr:serine/threonine-protein kinase [Sulfuricaulis sp.]